MLRGDFESEAVIFCGWPVKRAPGQFTFIPSPEWPRQMSQVQSQADCPGMGLIRQLAGVYPLVRGLQGLVIRTRCPASGANRMAAAST